MIIFDIVKLYITHEMNIENKHLVEKKKTYCFKGMKIIPNVHGILIYLRYTHYM